MTVLTEILAAAGIFLLILLLILLWIIIVPRHIWVEYSKPDGLIVRLKLAFLKVRVYPLPAFIKRKEKNQQDESDKKQNKDKKEKTGNPLSQLELSFSLIGQIIQSAKGFMQRVFKGLKFTDVSFTLPIYGGDVLNTQKLYGVVTNSFYSLSILLQKYMQVYYKSPVFIADFADRYSGAVYFYTKITASPILLLTAAFYGYSQYEQIMENHSKTKQPDNTVPTQKEIKNG